jgi:CheY-like chemotaxis protein
LHGGSVAVESEYGKGSTFRVSVPAGASHLPQEQIGGIRTQASTGLGVHPFIDEAIRWLPGEVPVQDAIIDVALPPDQTTVPEAQRALVLLADDNADMRDYLTGLLIAHYRVEAVSDGEAALKAVARRMPSLLLSDVMMPRMDGMELLSCLRADPRTAVVPVILLSARAGEEAKVETLDAGADDYLVKPFSARELLARVDAHLKIASVRGEAMESLRGSEERYRAFVTATSDVVYRMSANWSEMRHLRGKDFIPDTDSPSSTWLETYISIRKTSSRFLPPSMKPSATEAHLNLSMPSSASTARWGGPIREPFRFLVRMARSSNGLGQHATSASSNGTKRRRSCW